jgi:hypothetical protein
MVNRTFLCVLEAFACIVLFSLLMGPPALAKGLKSHPGRVIDSRTQQPISADITAYTVQGQTGDSGGCPMYGVALDAKQADSHTGDFTLKITDDQQAFRTTFCRTEYYPRTEVEDNSKGGSLVQPYPTEIFPRSGSPEDFTASIHRTVKRVLSDLRYLQGLRPKEFSQTFQAWQLETKDEYLKMLIPILLKMSQSPTLGE